MTTLDPNHTTLSQGPAEEREYVKMLVAASGILELVADTTSKSSSSWGISSTTGSTNGSGRGIGRYWSISFGANEAAFAKALQEGKVDSFFKMSSVKKRAKEYIQGDFELDSSVYHTSTPSVSEADTRHFSRPISTPKKRSTGTRSRPHESKVIS